MLIRVKELHLYYSNFHRTLFILSAATPTGSRDAGEENASSRRSEEHVHISQFIYAYVSSSAWFGLVRPAERNQKPCG